MPRMSPSEAISRSSIHLCKPSTSAIIYPISNRNNAEVVITTSAPASRYFTTSVTVGYATGSRQRCLDPPGKDRDPEQRQTHLVGRAQFQPVGQFHAQKIDVGLQHAIEEHEPTGAMFHKRRREMTERTEKRGKLDRHRQGNRFAYGLTISV
jgi:hypothetical protein